MISINAYAKINFFLKICSKRPDGYHGIESIIQKISLYDRIILERNNSGQIELEAIGKVEDEIPLDENNLAFKAAKIYFDALNISDGLTIKIEKNIPTSAGLGGGSSDAAATLIGVNSLWMDELPQDRLAMIAEKIGSDVPFFLYGKTALVTGKGEKVSPVPSPEKTWLVLVKPELAISSRWAYEAFDNEMKSSCITNRPDIKDMIYRLDEKSTEELSAGVYNDFENVIYKRYPKLKEIKNKFISLGAVSALLAGSGSVIFGIFNNKDKAKEVHERLISERIGKIYLCHSLH